jgi:valyl-tRNA synthetase
MKNLDQKYNHLKVEDEKYNKWVEKGYFTAGDKSKDAYTIVIPPPNVTGKLHLGHAWDNTLQDIIARYQRLKGKDMLYLPGMDHAGIATQAKVDARLKSEGISRYDLGRDKFLERAWEWKDEYASTIRTQWSKIGISLDYSRERFTLDSGLNLAVRKVFVDLYNDGLLYRGHRIINWDPKAQTALSNIEVIHKEVKGAFYTFNYKVQETDDSFDVATTRPETMFGDVCVVVHPDDEKFQHLIGKHAINPANGDVLPIIADDYIEIGFGTGAMKCTPAHDPNDFEIAKRHDLPKILCMNPDGTMNEICGEFNGMDRFDCRDKLVEKIKAEGNLVSIEEHIHQVGHSERTNVIVEPYLSEQWFVKMKPLAKEVLKYQQIEAEKINFYPERFEKTFIQWLENIEDWCVSRQLWWGHRIPAYYHKVTGEIFVGMEAPTDIENYNQDEDVLDTWFSSALWPFTTLGWPEKTLDLEKFYPTSTMVTGYDIIFFWVARMAFQARYFTDSRPFKDCLIHGLIRDETGRKMSKSLGNGIDPMDVIEKYGVDALRFFLTTNSTPGQDMRYSTTKVESSWNFINKIWNASKFVIMNIEDDFDMENIELNNLSLTDKWIIKRLNDTIASVNINMDKYEFALAGNQLHSFVWDDFCSYYIEFSKSGLNSDDKVIKNATISTLITVLNSIVKLLHPFMPFVTEEIYQTLNVNKESICIESWPETINVDLSNAENVDGLIAIIKSVRQIKVDNDIKPSKILDTMILKLDKSTYNINAVEADILMKMCKANVVNKIDGELMVRPLSIGTVTMLMSDVVDLEAEILKLEAEKLSLEKEISRGEKMIANPNFVQRAAPEKVQKEKDKLENYKKQYLIVDEKLIELSK